ncbi:hypothetical protein GCM10018785_10580 [Streptomyces longispororuber]|uniref:Uncharacterized protein n=1 Tax=Streptomyces longispororuber TaxID=68230 RepID=A0A919DGQ5_9ACTN|nr:hypothetical protein GCM10018785_10580 [Streptomyces longispororuber]
MSAALRPVTARIIAVLHRANHTGASAYNAPGHEIAQRVSKVAEEAGGRGSSRCLLRHDRP